MLERAEAFQELGGERQGTPRQRATALLISASWINGQAAQDHLAPSARAVRKALEEREQANGRSEFQSALDAAGQTVGDVKLEVRTELAASAIGHRLATRPVRVTQAEVTRFYRRNRWLFVEPEKRDAELIENLPSPAAATALVRRIGTGAGFAKRALKEALARNAGGASNFADIESVTDAIFAARPGVVSRPMRLNNRWTVFIVRKVRPAKHKPLTAVRTDIVQRLLTSRRREIKASFERDYKARWTAKTSCRVGYVVPKCVQYRGPARHEESPFQSE